MPWDGARAMWSILCDGSNSSAQGNLYRTASLITQINSVLMEFARLTKSCREGSPSLEPCWHRNSSHLPSLWTDHSRRRSTSKFCIALFVNVFGPTFSTICCFASNLNFGRRLEDLQSAAKDVPRRTPYPSWPGSLELYSTPQMTAFQPSITPCTIGRFRGK